MPEEKKYVVIHDGFELKAWKDFMRGGQVCERGAGHPSVSYVCGDRRLRTDLPDYLDYIRGHFAKDIEEMQQYFDVIWENGVFSTPWPAAVTQWEAGARVKR